MTPLSSEPAIIVIEPSDHGTDIESAINRVELEGGAGNFRSVWNHSSFNNWTEQLCAFLKSQTFETAAECVKQDESSRIKLCY